MKWPFQLISSNAAPIVEHYSIFRGRLIVLLHLVLCWFFQAVDFLKFLFILALLVVAYAIGTHAMFCPQETANSNLFSRLFTQPWFSLYGVLMDDSNFEGHSYFNAHILLKRVQPATSSVESAFCERCPLKSVESLKELRKLQRALSPITRSLCGPRSLRYSFGTFSGLARGITITAYLDDNVTNKSACRRLI